MKISFDRYEETQTNPNAKGKTFPIIRVYGTALEGKLQGKEWKTQFFMNASDLVSQVKSLSKGDTVNVKMTANGNYWNPTEFTKETSAGSIAEATHAATIMPVTNPKLDMLQTAIKIMGKKGAKESELEYLIRAKEVVGLVESFVKDDGPFQFDDAGIEADIPDVDDTADE